MKTVTRFIAKDGNEFSSRGLCMNHESNLKLVEPILVVCIVVDYSMHVCRDLPYAMRVLEQLSEKAMFDLDGKLEAHHTV